MKADDGVEAQVVITDESALMGLQIRRLFRAGGGEHRNVYDSIDRAEVFIRSHLSAAELTAFRRFIADYVPTA